MTKLIKNIIVIMVSVLFGVAFANAELTKDTVVDKMEVLENGVIQVRQAKLILEDGQIVSKQFHRYVIAPGQDVSDKDQEVQDLAASIWTQAVIDDYKNPKEPEVTQGLTKKQSIERIDIIADGRVIPHFGTSIYEKGKLIGRSSLNREIKPGDDFSSEPGMLKAVCQTVQTQDVIDKFKSTHETKILEDPKVTE
jgi:hypothetical protein